MSTMFIYNFKKFNEELKMYDLDENNNSLLSEFSGEIIQVIENIPIKIGYTIFGSGS